MKTVVVLLFTWCYLVGGAMAQGSTFHFTKPEFMETVFLERNMLKTCQCFDKDSIKTDDLNLIDSCRTYFHHRQIVYNKDTTSMKYETRYDRLLATYSRRRGGWLRREYNLAGEQVEAYIIFKDPDRRFDTVDSVMAEDYHTGELNLEITTITICKESRT